MSFQSKASPLLQRIRAKIADEIKNLAKLKALGDRAEKETLMTGRWRPRLTVVRIYHRSVRPKAAGCATGSIAAGFNSSCREDL
jgi:hypothetical protein